METFRLIVDRKVEVWRRDNVSIEAESLEEAVNKAIEHDYLVPDDSEYLYDTECTMSPEQVFPYNSATISETATNAASPLRAIRLLPRSSQCKYPPRFEA